MKATTPWITYRTRFLIKAKQLTNSLAFTDVLGRQHSGRKGDYLVESSDGVLRIAPRQIFEDIYVPLQANEFSEHTTAPYSETSHPSPPTKRDVQDRYIPSAINRKLPQAVRRIPSLGLRSQ